MVVTPPTSVASSAAARRSSASSRVAPRGDQLGDHRVVAGPDLVPCGDAGLDADRLGQPQALETSGLRQERARILGIEPHLDGRTVRPRLHVEPLPLRDPQLPLHEVDVPHGFRDWVLHLDASVQLEEEELASLEHELHRACADVADRAREAHRGFRHLCTQLGVECGRRRLLEHFLVAALHRALTLAECEHRAVRVGKQLDLDVPRPLQVPLEVDAVVAEPGLRLAPGGGECVVELVARADDAHAAAAAPGGRLDDQGRLGGLGHGRHAGLGRDALRLELVAATTQRVGRGPDPGEAGCFDRFGKVAVLRQEPVAGMDRVRARLASRADVFRGIEVRGDLDGLVRRPRMQRPRVVGCDDRDRAEAELPRGAEDAQGDLPAVCDEHLLHGPEPTGAPSPASGVPAAAGRASRRRRRRAGGTAPRRSSPARARRPRRRRSSARAPRRG